MKRIMIKILALFIIFIVSFIALESFFRLYRETWCSRLLQAKS